MEKFNISEIKTAKVQKSGNWFTFLGRTIAYMVPKLPHNQISHSNPSKDTKIKNNG